MEVVALPDDVLADVLRRVPPRSLAAVRCVCKAWRSIVDARGLLLPHLLPHSVHGIFVNYIDHRRPHLFARPSTPSTVPRIDGMLGFMPKDHKMGWWYWTSVLDHCNGLLLCDIWCQLCVCNPATQRCELLPQRTETLSRLRRNTHAYLVFDPAVSPHFEVFLIPAVPEKPTPPNRNHRKVVGERRRALLRQPVESPQPPPASSAEEDEPDDPWCLMEWPPSPWRLNVFSSRTGRWEERAFVREGEPAGTVADMRLDPPEPTMWGPRQGYAVYWQGAIYVHCRSGAFVTRFSLSNDKYEVIKTPTDVEKEYTKPYLGRSEKGVCFGIVHDEYQLEVWILNESCGQMEWVLQYQHDLRPLNAQQVASRRGGAWMVIEEEEEDNFALEYYDEIGGFNILGFHPYKEVVFLDLRFRAVAYHLNNSKAQYLGYLRPNNYYCHANGIHESFVYTPCMIGELHGDRSSS